MPFREETVMDQKMEFVMLARQQAIPFSQLCKQYDISRPCGYKWLRRYQQAGSITGLVEQSRRPRHSPLGTPQEMVDQVVALRRNQSWGARKIRALMPAGQRPSEATINRILAREQLITTPQPRPARHRFQREACNQLWQMDFKGEYQVAEGACYPLCLLDDHSRYLVGLWPIADQQTETVKAVLEPLFRERGVPQEMLLDHGTPWWSTSNEYGWTRLAIWLMQQDIQLIYAGRRHPQTSGKLERQNRTLKERTRSVGLPATLAEWQPWAQFYRWEYNHIRPHEALGLVPPATVYQAIHLRKYQEKPKAWDYGTACTARLNSCGCLYWQGRQYFVCEALAEQQVRLDEVDDLLVVTFRRTTIREINLTTGKTQAVMLTATCQ